MRSGRLLEAKFVLHAVARIQDVDWTSKDTRIAVPSHNTKLFHIQFRAKSWGGTNEPVTRSRLAMQIAKRVTEFLEVSSTTHPGVAWLFLFINSSKAMEDVESTDMAWKVGRGHITPRDLVLVSLARVSKGSWQPLLRLLA